MVDSIVSVRMPSSLVQKLKLLSEENHFLDVSEELRSIIKIKVRNYKLKLGEAVTIREGKTGRKEETGKDYKTENVVKEELVKRLKMIIKELEHDN